MEASRQAWWSCSSVVVWSLTPSRMFSRSVPRFFCVSYNRLWGLLTEKIYLGIEWLPVQQEKDGACRRTHSHPGYLYHCIKFVPCQDHRTCFCVSTCFILFNQSDIRVTDLSRSEMILVLPQPDAPTKAANCPLSIVKLSPRKTGASRAGYLK